MTGKIGNLERKNHLQMINFGNLEKNHLQMINFGNIFFKSNLQKYVSFHQFIRKRCKYYGFSGMGITLLRLEKLPITVD